jgi:cell pole-organizing protein PopZ
MPRISLAAEHARLRQGEAKLSMSTSQTPPGSPAGSDPGAGSAAVAPNDPSMEDILASIRRILSEDEVTASATPAPRPKAMPSEERAADDGVLVLDSAMMVSKPPETVAPAPEQVPIPLPPVPQIPPATAVTAPQALIAPEAAAAATASVDSLVRTLAAERTMQVHSGGPTIEDIVREELRPLLKAWLDENLPPMVERLVRVEIERVVGRVAP